MRNPLIVTIQTPEAQGEGAWIKFKRLSWGERRQVRDDISELKGIDLDEYIWSFVFERLVDFSWQDADGKALAVPKSKDDIDDYTDEEIDCMLGAAGKAIRGELVFSDEEKKG